MGSRVRRVEVFDFGTGRVGYLQKSSIDFDTDIFIDSLDIWL